MGINKNNTMTRENIWKVTINDEYDCCVESDSGHNALLIAKEFYLKNNHFLPKEITTWSYKLMVSGDSIIN